MPKMTEAQYEAAHGLSNIIPAAPGWFMVYVDNPETGQTVKDPVIGFATSGNARSQMVPITRSVDTGPFSPWLDAGRMITDQDWFVGLLAPGESINDPAWQEEIKRVVAKLRERDARATKK